MNEKSFSNSSKSILSISLNMLLARLIIYLMQTATYEMDLHTVQNHRINAITICIDALIILQASVY